MPLINGEWVAPYAYPDDSAGLPCWCGHKAYDHAEFFQETPKGCLRRFCGCALKFHMVVGLAHKAGEDET